MKRQEIPIKWEATYLDRDAESSLPLVRLCSDVFKGGEIVCGTWVRIKSNTNHKVIYRIAKGCPKGVSGLDKDTIMVNTEDVFALGADELVDSNGRRIIRGKDICIEDISNKTIQKVYSADWTVSMASLVDGLRAQWCHPDRGYRASMQIAYISLAVGVLGFITGLLGILF